MKNKLKKKINRIALLIGFLACAFILVSSLYLAYIKTLQEASQYLKVHASTVTKRMEMFLKEINTSLKKINKTNKQCDRRAEEALKRLVLNEPQLSIAYIKTKHSQCASTSHFQFDIMPETTKYDFLLKGPLQINDIIQNAFLLQFNKNNKEIGVIFPGRILDELLHEPANNFVTHALYAKKTKSILFSAEPHHTPFSLSSHIPSISHENKLAFLPNITLHSELSHQWIFKKFKPHMILATLIALIVCLFLTFIIYRMTKHKLSLEHELRCALKNDQFIPYYQPVIELATGRLAGVECLMRWEIDELDILQPDLFIPTAERSGLIKPMTHQLIQTIFNDLGPYAKANRDFHIAINLSPQHFKDRNTYQQVIDCCIHHDINSNQIIFELTEQELIKEDDDYAVGIMKDMRNAGYSLAVDDFGTGYSSISYLQRFPFNFLKIDKQFVMAIGSNAVTAQLADSMIDLARNLNLKVIAEGLEEPAQEKHLKNRHILYGQGWLYSKALSFEELEKYIQKQMTD